MAAFSVFSPAPDYSFENGLRAREHQLEPMISTSRARMAALHTGAGRLSPNRGPSRAITSGVPTVGAVRLGDQDAPPIPCIVRAPRSAIMVGAIAAPTFPQSVSAMPSNAARRHPSVPASKPPHAVPRVALTV